MSTSASISVSIVARITACYTVDPGSIPGQRAVPSSLNARNPHGKVKAPLSKPSAGFGPCLCRHACMAVASSYSLCLPTAQDWLHVLSLSKLGTRVQTCTGPASTSASVIFLAKPTRPSPQFPMYMLVPRRSVRAGLFQELNPGPLAP